MAAATQAVVETVAGMEEGMAVAMAAAMLVVTEEELL